MPGSCVEAHIGNMLSASVGMLVDGSGPMCSPRVMYDQTNCYMFQA